MTHGLDKSKTSLVARTLWRIEASPAKATSLAALAAEEGVSAFHLTRAFGLVTGQPVMAYVRARRLSEAARQLHSTQDSVLNIALDAGYQSHEGFARAFRDMFGSTPSAARNALPQHLQEQFQMSVNSNPTPEARIVEDPGLRIVGRTRRFSVADRPKIPSHWDETLQEIGQHFWGKESFGVCHAFDEHEAFNYLVGFEDDGRTDSSELDHVILPAGRYAVFDHRDHISSISETWAGIFDGGLEKAGVETREGPEFERYSAEFRPEKPGGVAVWIPVR